MATEIRKSEIPKFILDALRKSIEDEYDLIEKEVLEKFAADLKRRREHVIAGVMLNVTNHMNVQTFGDRIVVEIIKLDEKPHGTA